MLIDFENTKAKDENAFERYETQFKESLNELEGVLQGGNEAALYEALMKCQWDATFYLKHSDNHSNENFARIPMWALKAAMKRAAFCMDHLKTKATGKNPYWHQQYTQDRIEYYRYKQVVNLFEAQKRGKVDTSLNIKSYREAFNRSECQKITWDNVYEIAAEILSNQAKSLLKNGVKGYEKLECSPQTVRDSYKKVKRLISIEPHRYQSFQYFSF